ncbi:hypothetical protein JCM19300_219 [Algibacter lectus]|uniref:Uncharacterized protein n=1 Tax=Algibacter lectus TaxID=221126 RepID=A0A090WBZ6_9FLAO|nr:hypothetical protein JCM19300_219 [Algibacter lectus]
MNGVRLYLAAYPEKNYQNTLFFAPTGYTVNSEASFFNTSFLLDDADDDIPVDPLNDGGTGETGYP